MASRKRKSLSSILKTVSPSRTALSDLNPNVNELPTDETVHLDLIEKKKRRSSRRVSFAETYQVKEFLKDSDRKELGPWNDSQDDLTHQELPANEQANVQSDHAGPSGSHHDQAHRITGLETLLSGPIKQEAHSMTSVEQDPYGSPFKRAAQQLNQCPQNYNMEQRKNDINEISVKSSFLKSVIAADSSFAAPAFRSYASTSRQQAEDQEDRPRGSSFKNTFLQAIVAAEPSPSDALGSMKHQSQPRNVDPGMEFTNCYDPSDITNRYEGNKEKVGDITRIFGGQGDGFENDNGMDMTTCMGGFETMQKKLERPAAESTRIFDAENTNKMELTECLKGFGGISCSTNKSLGRTLNQTGNNLNFTQVFGKMSESDYADMPHESTARLLQRIDDAIAGSDCSGAETTGVDNSKTGHMNVLHSTRNNTQKSIALDTIQEVSSSTVSMLNSTCRDKSAVSASSVLEACTEDDEMDITTCSNYTKDIRIRSAQEEMYRSLDKNEVMCGVGNSVSAVKPKVVVSSSVVAKGSGGDHTRVLDQAADDSAEMEMTCAITQPLIKGNEVKEELPRAPALSDEDRTRVFTSEDTAMMEMTCVVSGASRSALNIESVHQQKMIPSSVASKVVSHTHYAKDANDSDDMEMTCAINQTLMTGSQAKGQLPQLTVVDDKDTTRVFNSDDTAAMEMTCAMNQPVIIGSQSRGKPQTLQATSNVDKTRVFNSDDTAAMEMTCAMNQPVIIGSQSRGKPQTLQATSNEDKTRVFNSDDTAAMEMTCAMNQPVIIGSQSRGKPQILQATSNEDKTRVFNSDDTAAMEMTCAMSGVNTSAFSFRNKHQSKILSSAGLSSSGREHASSFASGLTHLVDNDTNKATEDTTTCFENTTYLRKLPEGLAYQMRTRKGKQGMDILQNDDTACMEMTECVSAPPSIFSSENADLPTNKEHGTSQPKMMRQQDYENTKIYDDENTGHMEMTTCIDALPSTKIKGKACRDDQTHVFNNEDTANMEMTCVGVVLPPLSKAKKIPKNISEEPTHISQSEDPSTNMESTACVLSGNSTLTVNAHAGRPVNSDVLGKTLLFSQSTCDDTGKNQTQSETSDVAFPRMKVEQMILPQFSTESEMKKTQQTTQVIDVSAVINTEQSLRDTDDFKIQEKNAAGEEIHQKDGEINISGDIPHDKTSDTYTLTHPALQQDEDNQLGEELAAQEKLQQGRNLDTFTINNSSVTGSGKRKLSSLTEGMSQRSTSASSEEGKSKANEEGSSSSPDSESHASFVLKDSIILPDWIDAEDEKGILDELPIDNDNTEDLCMTSNKRQRIDDAVFTSSYMDASHLTSNLSHLPLSSERGSTSVEDFLQMLFKFNDLPMGKRSVMCPTKITEPSTLSNQLEDTCVIKPKADMYEWAIKFLTPTVQELRKSVASQDPKHFEENVPIIKELQSAGPERCSEILEKGKNLEKYCKASSKTKMKGWRLQMIKNTRTAMQDSSQHFGNKLAKVTSSISTIEELLQQLNSVESSLDDAIKSLEEMTLPSEGEKSEWIANQQRLELMETNLKEQERAVQETECKRRRLEGEVKSLEDSTMKLEAEQEILSRSGKVTNQSETDIENMKSEILLLQSLQEWRLQAFQENNYKFSSLGKSILLHIKYGDKERGNKLIDVTLHSVLAHDACSSAKLAHSLFFSSVNTDQLKTLYPTYNDLPQMMQHMSELVGQVRLLEAEVSRIDFWHPVTTTHNRLSIEFSSIETHCMLCIHLDLLPGQYPFTRIPHSSIIKIGKISEKAISDTIDAVQPGWGYISRITKGIEQLLLKHST